MKKATEALRIINYFILPFSILSALMSPMTFDAPGSENSILNWLWFLLMISYPIIIITSLVLSKKYYKQEKYNLSFWTSLFPALPGSFFFLWYIVMMIIYPIEN